MLARSERLVLRRLHEGDLPLFQAYRSDPEVARFQSWAELTDNDAREFLAAMSRVPGPLQSGHWTQIAVASLETGELMGDMGLHLSEDGTEAEIGITLARAHHGRGFAKEAMILAIELVFETPTVERIICGADRRNTPSIGLIRRLGFVWTHEEIIEGLDGLPHAIDDMFVLQRHRSGS